VIIYIYKLFLRIADGCATYVFFFCCPKLIDFLSGAISFNLTKHATNSFFSTPIPTDSTNMTYILPIPAVYATNTYIYINISFRCREIGSLQRAAVGLHNRYIAHGLSRLRKESRGIHLNYTHMVGGGDVNVYLYHSLLYFFPSP
jgi:hypothetical protein